MTRGTSTCGTSVFSVFSGRTCFSYFFLNQRVYQRFPPRGLQRTWRGPPRRAGGGLRACPWRPSPRSTGRARRRSDWSCGRRRNSASISSILAGQDKPSRQSWHKRHSRAISSGRLTVTRSAPQSICLAICSARAMPPPAMMRNLIPDAVFRPGRCGSGAPCP